MDQLMGYWFSSKAEEINNVGKDINNAPKKMGKGAKKMVQAATEKKQKPLTEVLKEYNLPGGLFPNDVKKYELDEETKKLTVTLKSICEVTYRDSSILRFAASVTGHLEKGKLSDIEGLKTKGMLWVKVTCVVREDLKLHFTAGLGKTRETKVYEMVRDAIPVDKF
ncbi:hypothetical protein L2E82_01467 [Cichorium intybus]|uniref:Uncharacterized protein n=1 Tax=Cichorium intybus TaxID=13427 RepID=A0ACB9GYN2_CICIN|nr:hypothetical protein L2E82_01467 [Cichorium intybus]